jgi:RNA polymerase sigma factor (sigma-70 family)
VPPADPETSRWFSQCLEPHEPMLRAWLSSRFPVLGDIDDIVQDAYIRVLRARESVTIESPKAFLYTTAQNIALGLLRQRKIRLHDSLAEFDLTDVLDEAIDIPQAVAHSQELQLLTEAIQSLPARCRQIITLRKIYGMSQKDVAARLGISEHTVEAQGTIGLRKVMEFFARIQRRQHLRHG